jgi:hypothetical protein
MAEIKVQIKGDNEDFKRKMAESGAEACGFATQVKESLDQVKEGAADIAGETGFGGLKKVLTGLGGVAFGAMIVEQFKKAIEASLEWEKQVAALKTALPQAFQGMAESLQEWVESVSGGLGTVDENIRVFRALLQSGMNVKEAQTALIDLQNAAAKVGVSVEELGMKFAEMKSTGEVPARFFREMPALAPIARGLGMTENPSAEWMIKTLLPNIAPGGLQSPVRQEMESTASAQLARFGVELENVSQTLGVELLPTLKEWLADFKENIPIIGKTAKELGSDLAQALQYLHKNLGWLFSDIAANRYPGQRTVESWHDKLSDIASGHMGSVIDLKAAAQEQRAAAEALHRAVNPQ